MSKFVTRSLRHREVGREEDAGVPYDKIIEKCKEKLSTDARYWSNEVKQDLKMTPYWSAENRVKFLSKGGGQKKRFQYCLKPNCLEKLLYCRAIQGHSGNAYSGHAPVNLALQGQCIVTEGFCQVRLSRRKRKGIEINSA